MLSSDKNIETIAQFVEVVKHYLGLQTEYVKLDVIDKVVRLLTAAALAIVFFLMAAAVVLFLSIALALWLAGYVGQPLAFVIVALLYLVLLVLFAAKRKRWIERPLVQFLAGLLMK